MRAMTRRSTPQLTIDDRAYPVRIEINQGGLMSGLMFSDDEMDAGPLKPRTIKRERLEQLND